MDDLSQAQAHHHQRIRMDAINEAFKATISAGSAALKVFATVNAGGVVALMGFLSSIAGKGLLADFGIFKPAIVSFGCGLFAAVLATGSMYFAQASFQGQGQSIAFLNDSPYVEERPAASIYHKCGRFFQLVTITAGLTSLFLFAKGLYNSLAILGALRNV